MSNGFLRAILATAILSLCLGLMRRALPFGDWALLLLLPLAGLLFTGHRQLAQQVHQSHQRVVWHEMSWPMRLFTGRIGATVWAGVFTIISVPLIAWQAVVLPPSRLPQIGGAFLMAALLFAMLSRFFGRHLQDPFHRRAAITTSTWIIAVPFALLAAWQTFKLDVIPAELLNASFSQLPATAIKTLPFRDSILSTIMWPLHFLDCLKQWIAGHHPQYRWLAMLISLDAGLYGFLMARTAAVITDRLHLPVDARPRSPSGWFWGTIVTVMVVTLTLQMVGMERVKRVVSRMWWKLPGSGLRACDVGSSQAARSRDIGTSG